MVAVGEATSRILIGMPSMTTIKVSVELRDRIAADAARRGVSMAGLLAELVQQDERRQRFAAVATAYAHGTEDSHGYEAERASWDATLADGLDG